jgi:hypothetical protein
MWTKVTELSADPTIYAQQLAENMRLSKASAAAKAEKAGKAPVARIVSIDPLAAYIATKQAEMVEALKKEYFAEHPEAALPAALQNKTAAEVTEYIKAERAKLDAYEKAVPAIQAKQDKADADKAAAIKATADAALAEAAAEAARIKSIEEMNATLTNKHNSRH